MCVHRQMRHTHRTVGSPYLFIRSFASSQTFDIRLKDWNPPWSCVPDVIF